MKQCLECNERILGRSDKKFCSDACRSSFHNQKKEQPRPDLSQYQLMVNHRLLNFLFATRKKWGNSLSIQPLLTLGFNPNVFTSCYEQNGKEYRFCYEYAYCVNNGELELLV